MTDARIYDRKSPGEPVNPAERYGVETLLPSGKYRRIGMFSSRKEALAAVKVLRLKRPEI